MAYVNTYTPPSPPPIPSDPYGLDPWDINFVFPFPSALQNSLVKLTPLIPRLHADALWDVAGASDPSLYRYIRSDLRMKEQFLAFLRASQADPTRLTFLVIDKARTEVKEELQPGGLKEGELGGRMAAVMYTTATMSPIYHGRICSQKHYKYQVWAGLQFRALCAHDKRISIVTFIQRSLYDMTILLLIPCYNLLGCCVDTLC
jgi:hypothetical protein